MKIIKLIILLKIFLTSHYMFSQDSQELNFIEVQYKEGYTIYGTVSVRLAFEGMILRIHKKRKECIKFIQFDKLNKNKLIKLMEYVNYSNLMSKKLVSNDTLCPQSRHGSTRRFTFVDILKEKSNFIDMECFDEELNQVLKLLNDLIPIRYRKKFSVKLMIDDNY